MKKIIVITGARGAGKSTAAARIARPSETGSMFVVDTEDSMSDIVENNLQLGLSFGEYVRAYDRFKPDADMLESIARGRLPWVTSEQRNTLAGYYEWFASTLNQKLVKGKYKYFVIDTVEPIEAAMTAWAETSRDKSGWSGTKAYGRLETEAVRPLYENLLEAIARRGVETIVLTSHLKRPWEKDRPILNKVQPGGRLTVLARLSSMMFWLVQSNNSDGAPAAIVLKARLGVESIEGDEWHTLRQLPRRIPHFTWADVRRYYGSPADLAHPAPGEVPTAAEEEMISEFLTDAQMRLMVLGEEQELEDKKQQLAGMTAGSTPTMSASVNAILGGPNETGLTLAQRIRAQREMEKAAEGGNE